MFSSRSHRMSLVVAGATALSSPDFFGQAQAISPHQISTSSNSIRHDQLVHPHSELNATAGNTATSFSDFYARTPASVKVAVVGQVLLPLAVLSLPCALHALLTRKHKKTTSSRRG